MIVEKQLEAEREQLEQQRENELQIIHVLAADSVHGDAPPAYEDLVDDSLVLNSRKHKELPPDPPSDDKKRLEKSEVVRRPPASASPIAGPSTQPLSAPRQASSTSFTTASSSSWFPLLSSKGKSDVRSTVLGLVRDLVRQAPSPVSSGLLDSCANACRSHGLPLKNLLQEPSVEGHTPLFWAILNWHSTELLEVALFDQLIEYSAPLEPSTIADMRMACLALADKRKQEDEHYSFPNSVLQRLRRNPSVFPPSGTDSILLNSGPAVSPPSANGLDNETFQCFHAPKRSVSTFEDIVRVFEISGSPDSYVVQMELEKFTKRMRVSRVVVAEFIARGRLWILQFFPVPAAESLLSGVRPETVTHVQTLQRLRSSTSNKNSWLRGNSVSEFPEGIWAASLGLLEGSIPAANGISARLVIPPSQSSKPSHDQESSSPSSSDPHPPTIATSIDTDASQPLFPGSFGPFLSRLLSSPLSVFENQAPVPTGSAVLGFKHFPFRNKHLDLDSSKAGQLLAPALPPFPSATDGSGANDGGVKRKGKRKGERPKEKRERESLECAYDVLASFEESSGGQAFDIGTHVRADGTICAVLEVRLLKPGESTDSDAGCIIC